MVRIGLEISGDGRQPEATWEMSAELLHAFFRLTTAGDLDKTGVDAGKVSSHLWCLADEVKMLAHLPRREGKGTWL